MDFSLFVLFAAADSKFLKTLLSFAVGGLLGDVFLHLLPEAWEYDMKDRNGNDQSFKCIYAKFSMIQLLFEF